MEGWIKLHRQISDNPLWTCEKFTRGQAWIDLIMLANHKDSFFYKRGVKVNIERGQVGWSSLALSERWKWSRSKVKKFLNDLEKEHQIVQQKSNVTQIVTLLNYDKFQQKEQQTVQQKDTKRTPKEHQKDTNKNDNNVKNDNNEKKTLLSDLKKSDFKDSKYFDYTIAFYKLFEQNLKDLEISTTTLEKANKKWIDPIRLLIEKDNYKDSDLKAVYNFIKIDEFWKQNIQSTHKLRKQFQTLLIRAKTIVKTNNNKNHFPDLPKNVQWSKDVNGKTIWRIIPDAQGNQIINKEF